MAEIRFTLDPSLIRVSEEEILADLAYPAPPGRVPAASHPPRPPDRRRQRRRSR